MNKNNIEKIIIVFWFVTTILLLYHFDKVTCKLSFKINKYEIIILSLYSLWTIILFRVKKGK